MPMMQTIYARANEYLAFENLEVARKAIETYLADHPDVAQGTMTDPDAFATFLEGIGVLYDNDPRGFGEYLRRWPTGVTSAILAGVRSAITKNIPVTFAWLPGYDFEVTFIEALDTRTSRGGMTVLIKSPYPRDLGIS